MFVASGEEYNVNVHTGKDRMSDPVFGVTIIVFEEDLVEITANIEAFAFR